MINSHRIVTLMLLLLNVGLVSSAQLLLKIGSGKLSAIIDKTSLLNSFLRIVFNPFIVSGTLCYVLSLVLWIYILTRSSLSIAYPLMSLSYLVVMLLSIFLIKEHVNMYQWIGGSLIVFGTFLIFYFKTIS